MTKLGMALSVATCLALAACSEEKIIEKKILKSDLLAATDARESENPVFDEALSASNWKALSLLGQVGDTGCEKLPPYFSNADAEARKQALEGAAYCYGVSVTPALIERLSSASSDEETGLILKALGYANDDTVTPVLIQHFDPLNADTVFALLQNIVYSRTPAADLPGLPYEEILAATSRDDVGLANAYFLTRLTGLETVLSGDQFVSAVRAVEDQSVQRLLIRVLPIFGEQSADLLLELAAAEEGPSAIEAVRSMGQMQDAATKAHLVSLLNRPHSLMKQLAVEAFAGRDLEDAEITQAITDQFSVGDHAIAASALATLASRDAVAAHEEAVNRLGSGVYYLAYKAMGQLSVTDEGRAALQAYAEANPETQRARDAIGFADPDGQNPGEARPTPDGAVVKQYVGKALKLTTTQGPIVISMLEETPYSAINFLQLAESGKMDGMLWHRVIPNFVAQAGQIEDVSLAEWGNIREEWFASDHAIGTVGLATIGKDTGSTQFFINTAYNLHLNGRYTVFGKVTEGIDNAMALREGDVIEKAEVVAAK